MALAGQSTSAISEISFEGQAVVVTGAGGALGRAYALEIARRGGRVLVNDLGCTVPGEGASSQAADAVVAEIREAGGTAIANYDSIATRGGAQNIVDAALSGFGRIDALINSAGNMRFGPFETMSIEDFSALLDVHVAGSFNIAQAAWTPMKARGYGRIVLTSSAAGAFGNRLMAGYAAAKTGIIGLVNVLALEGEADGILCNAILPTAESKMGDYVGAHSTARTANPTAQRMARFMDPAYAAGLATYLASGACLSAGGLYSSVGGRVARLVIGVGEGWRRDDLGPVTAEDLAAHFDAVTASPPRLHLPRTVQEEFAAVLADMPAAEEPARAGA